MRSAVVDLASQPLRNLSRDPRAVLPYGDANGVWASSRWFGGLTATGTYASVTGATDGPPGITSYKRKTWTVGGGLHTGDTGFDMVRARTIQPAGPGSVFTCGFWMRTNASGKVANLSGYLYGPDGSTPAVNGSRNSSSNTFALVPNTWHWIVRTVVVPASRTDVSWQMMCPDISINSSPLWAPGDTLDATGWVIVKGDVASSLGYADGDTPGWRWAGTVNASESVGYPYTLESIAGRPLASVAGAGLSSTPMGLGGFEGRTLYVVHDVFDTASNLASLAAIGPTSSSGPGRATLRTAAGTGTSIELRAEPLSGGPITFSTRAGVRTVGRHVSAGSMADALASSTVMVDGLTGPVTAFTAGGGMHVGTNNLLNLGPLSTSDNPFFALAYRGEHNDETKRRITAWLARQYGSPIPAGY